MADVTLYHWEPNANSGKPMLALAEKGVAFASHYIDMLEFDQHKPEYLAINPNAKVPDQVAILTREGCSYCARAKKLLAELGYAYAEVPLPHTIRTKVVGAVAGAKTVPQVFINGQLIGGLEALERWAKKAA